MPLLATRLETQELAAEAAERGAGAALLSPLLFADSLAHGWLVQPFTVVTSGPDAYYALKDSAHPTASAAAFLAWLIQEVA